MRVKKKLRILEVKVVECSEERKRRLKNAKYFLVSSRYQIRTELRVVVQQSSTIEVIPVDLRSPNFSPSFFYFAENPSRLIERN